MQEAIFICKTLKDRGYVAYFAGGWVRDFLLNHSSYDIDIATDAPPQIVESLFKHTVPIGAKFGIILVVIKDKQYEVATFRKDLEYKDGRRPSKVEFSSARIDAQRRDFTINGMFYDPIEEKVIDYVNGKEDLEKKIIKAIGDPNLRFKEDRLRMMRAIRLSCRFNFEIEENTKKAILKHSSELFPSVSIERIMQEITKMSRFKGFKNALVTLFEFNLLQTIFPKLKTLKPEEVEERLKIIDDFPKNTPAILSILELFPDMNLNEKIMLLEYLKLSNKEIKFVSFLHESKKMLENPEDLDNFFWTLFFANSFSSTAVGILGIHISKDNRKRFLDFLNQKELELDFFIKRMKEKNPIVKAAHLKELNIEDGKLMGELLKEAEKISINKNISDPSNVIKELKKSPIWPR